MATVNYNKASAYANTPQSTWFLSNMVYRPILKDGSDVLTIVSTRHEYKPGLLSYDLYGTQDYMWTFMILNPDLIKDPIWDMIPGLQIYTATLDRLHATLGS